jgi:hypothetical protein
MSSGASDCRLSIISKNKARPVKPSEQEKFINSRFMYRYFRKNKQYADHSEKTMENRDHLKNGANMKSHTSKGNLKINL